MSAEIKLFRIAATDSELEDLRRRLRDTWPERECLDDWSQKGGRFAAFEQPRTFVREECACFKGLR